MFSTNEANNGQEVETNHGFEPYFGTSERKLELDLVENRTTSLSKRSCLGIEFTRKSHYVFKQAILPRLKPEGTVCRRARRRDEGIRVRGSGYEFGQ